MQGRLMRSFSPGVQIGAAYSEYSLCIYTHGFYRNAALGVGDGDDRSHPDHVHIKSKEDLAALSGMNLSFRFTPIHARQIQMSKLHTAVVTMEGHGNLRLCGFGSGGRYA